MSSDEINVIISYESQAFEILKFHLEDKMEDILNEFATKKNLPNSNFLILYGGRSLTNDDKKKTISQIISSQDKFDGKMSLLLYGKNNISNSQNNSNINIVLMIDPKKIFVLQGKKEDTIKTILNKNKAKIDADINLLIFKYGNEIININKTFDDIANDIDQKFSGITLYAFKNKKLVVNFIFNNFRQFRTECSFDDQIRKICNIYCINNHKNINNCMFRFGKIDINLDETFNQLFSKNEDTNIKNEILSVNEPIIKEKSNREIDIIVSEKDSFCQNNKTKIIIALLILCIIIIAVIIIVVSITKESKKHEDPFDSTRIISTQFNSIRITNYLESTEIIQELTKEILQEPTNINQEPTTIITDTPTDTTKSTKKICDEGYFIPDDDETLEDCTKCSLDGCIECKGTYENNECINCGDLKSIYEDGKIIRNNRM